MGIGDTVILTSERTFQPNTKIPAGTLGVIQDAFDYITYVRFLVLFHGFGKPKMVSVNYLKKV